MRAAVCRAFGEPLTIEEVSLAPPGPDEVVVTMAAVAICHSDIAYMDGDWGGPLPAVYGHEASGTVAELGPGLTDLEEGDRVVVTLVRWCGECRFCRRGLQVACQTRFPLDERPPVRDGAGNEVHQAMRTGAFAEQVVVHRSQVVAVDDEMPFDAAALLACGVITGVGAVQHTAQVEAGSHVVVVGAGGVGLNAIQGAKLATAATITAVDIAPSKLEAARTYGATHVAEAGDGVASVVREATSGAMADYVLVTVGAKSAFDRAYELVAPGGAVVMVGMPAIGVTSDLDPSTLAALSQRILGSKMGASRPAEDIPRLVDLYRNGDLLLDQLITERFAFDDINRAIASSKDGNAIRNVVVFG